MTPYLQGLAQRTLAAARSLNEALNVAAPPTPVPVPGPDRTPPPPPAGPGALALPGAGLAVAPPPPQGPMPKAVNPLSMLSDFRSPPMEAALQGPQGMQGHPALNQPTGL